MSRDASGQRPLARRKARMRLPEPWLALRDSRYARNTYARRGARFRKLPCSPRDLKILSGYILWRGKGDKERMYRLGSSTTIVTANLEEWRSAYKEKTFALFSGGGSADD